MNTSQLSTTSYNIILRMQQQEMDSSAIYTRIAQRTIGNNQKILLQLAYDETKHAAVWASYTSKSLKPNRLRVFWISLLTQLLGFTFMVKYLEKGETNDIAIYTKLESEVPAAAQILSDEVEHEKILMGMLDEERLKYVGAMVLGMNDALVELTGALAGFTFAMQNTRIVALAGLITGISATLSMTASSYLSSKADGNADALKSSLYTGVMYLVTVALMVTPYFIFPNDMAIPALGCMFAIVVAIIFAFNFYISVAKDLSFKQRFTEMLVLCIIVTGVSFAIGSIFKSVLGINIG
ncbi:MAG: rubrerythrin family protein [Fibrobacteres bacterium CG2_30_45_31]|nr:MAG: rubrerythrin family protein [Fibrobacteres bacterium CG2_30_45_31]